MKKSEGFILLISAIIVSAIGTLVAFSVLYFATGFAKNYKLADRSNQARGLADACAELAIQKLVTSSVFVGTVNQTIGTGSCSYVITEPTASTALINVTATAASVIRKDQVNMNLIPLSVTKWQEVP
jgi:hypothetical protein